MKPRLSSSKKWTAFPKEFVDQIKDVFSQNFNDLVARGTFHIEGRIYSEEIMLRVGYIEKGRIKQANFEVSHNYSQEKQDALEKIHICIDAAASMLLEYVEKDGEVDFPLSWKEFPFQNHKVYLQFSTVNTDLEAQANELLGEADASLVYEDENFEDEEDALSRAEISEELSGGAEIDDELRDQEPQGDLDDEGSDENTEDEDSSEDKGPRLFGRPRKKKTPLH